MSLLKNIGRELGHEPPKPVARAFAPLPARRAPPRPEPAPALITRETSQAPRRAAPEPQEEAFGPGYLTRMLDRQDRITDDSRVGSDLVHISGLSDLCIRSYVLADDEQRVLEQRPTGGHRVMWKLGRAAEKHVREGIIADRQRKGVLGRWRCACRVSQRDGLWEPVNCTECGTGLDEYRELPLVDEEAGVIGNPDLMLYVGRRILPIEIKSMNAKDWAALEAPLPDHMFQGNGYHRLLTANRLPVMPVVAYIYVTKDFKWGSPYKEYHVEPDAITARVVSMAWTEVATLKAARESGALPRRVKCAAMTDPRAKKCPVAAACFQRSST